MVPLFCFCFLNQFLLLEVLFLALGGVPTGERVDLSDPQALGCGRESKDRGHRDHIAHLQTTRV